MIYTIPKWAWAESWITSKFTKSIIFDVSSILSTAFVFHTPSNSHPPNRSPVENITRKRFIGRKYFILSFSLRVQCIALAMWGSSHNIPSSGHVCGTLGVTWQCFQLWTARDAIPLWKTYQRAPDSTDMLAHIIKWHDIGMGSAHMLNISWGLLWSRQLSNSGRESWVTVNINGFGHVLSQFIVIVFTNTAIIKYRYGHENKEGWVQGILSSLKRIIYTGTCDSPPRPATASCRGCSQGKMKFPPWIAYTSRQFAISPYRWVSRGVSRWLSHSLFKPLCNIPIHIIQEILYVCLCDLYNCFCHLVLYQYWCLKVSGSM